MASVDGSYAKEEDELLLSIAARNGISSRRIEEIRENPERVPFEVPKQEGEKFRQIYDLVQMNYNALIFNASKTEFDSLRLHLRPPKRCLIAKTGFFLFTFSSY